MAQMKKNPAQGRSEILEMTHINALPILMGMYMYVEFVIIPAYGCRWL